MSEEDLNEPNNESSLFIRTEGAISRIMIVVDGMKSGIPLLLEGETGTSKTATAKSAAKEINQKAILFNFSSQTSVEDLLGRISKSSDDWGGFSFKKGPFTIAFEKGYCIILDEINLAHETVLQCIESSLDSRTLSLDFSGSEVDKTIQMHPDFHIIATQNPLTSKFSQKRNFLSNKFTSRFQRINFGEIERDELIEIATGLSINIDTITPEFINSLIQFHFEWQKNKYSCSITSNKDTNNSSTNYVFTIREICRTIKSIEKGLTPFESIMINYGSRYNNESQNAMKELLHSLGIKEEYKFFNSSFYIKYILENNSYSPSTKIVTTKLNNRFYMTKTLSDAYSTCFHLLDNYQPILLVGPNGCGKTSIGRWIGDLYTSYIVSQSDALDDVEDDEMKHSYKFFICNPEMTISDIIGRYLPNKQSTSRFANPQAANPDDNLSNNYSDAPIEWMYGPVVKAMVNGDCLILDQIDTAPSTILERLNSLFDGLGVKNFKFPIQENLENPEAPVDPKFRIIATSSLSGLNDLSPAFLNRFTVIYINEQLDSIDDQLPQFIRCISPYSTETSKGTKDITFISDSVEKTLSKDNILTSLNLSKCVNGFFKLSQRFPEANKNSILKFCFDACIYHTTTIPEMDEDFINILLESLAEDDRKDTEFDAFHFKEAKSTRKVMATLVACSVIGLHTILVGKTGSGKTTAAMAFSRMNKFSSRTSTTPIIAFNGETQLDELYGYFTIEKGNFTLHQGELSKAMSDGEVFIADELNLADQQIIQSLNVAIEPSCGETIILPVTGSSVEIKEGFFFIGCQNDLTMNGRRPIPESIKKKILLIDYPENSPEDLLVLCNSIAKQFSFDRAIPKYTAALVEKIKTEPSLRMKPWSLREVRTLFRRIAYFKTKTQDIKGFTAIHHVSFMLASSYQNYDEMIDKIAELVCTSFMQKSMIHSLTNDLKAKIKVEKYPDTSFVDKEKAKTDDDSDEHPKDESKSHYKIRLTKGSLELNISNAQLNDVPENIQTLWQTVFNIYLTTQSEPLLFNGPSGFKTYLSELFSSLAPVIYLHSDSTISSLVGQIALLDYYQAKLCLLEAIDDFTGHDMTLKEPLNEIKKQLEENDEIDEESLRSVVDKIKENVPQSFVPIIVNVANRLIGIQNEEKDSQNNVKVVGDRMFSNYISIFKAGLITKSIFSQNSLILKNFAQPAPSVIERFNELLSVTPQLTLFEDTTNTFTTPTNNKIYGFSNVFRIIAICLPPEKRNLSDAMLSRLTEIYIPTYSQDDQESVFKTYLEKQLEHDISLTIKPLSILKKALKAFEDNELNISFRQKIKIIQIANQWQKKFPDMDVLTIYIISIMRCAGGPLPFELKQHLYQILEKTFNPKGDLSEFPSQLAAIYKLDENDDAFLDTYQYTMPYPCLSLINDGELICSSLTNFSYPNISITKNKLNEEKPNFVFSYSNYDLIDLIFSLSIINYPLIIEGPNGCGKSSAFFYVAECLGVKVIQISISRSTTVEDLFGRFEPNAESENLQFDFKPTAFLNAIDNDRSSGDKYWILIEELHLASPSVIDALEPIFNPQSDHVTLPDGSYVQRGNFFIVGLLSKSLQKQSITNTAMYYKVRNYTKNEFTEICKFILESNDYGSITKRICPILEKLYEISASSHIKIPVTPREAHKFVKMMNAATQHPHKTDQLSDIEISQILFLGRFAEEGLKNSIKELLDEILKEQGFTQNEEIPEFTTENGGSTLTSQKVSIDVSMRTQSRHNEIDHLTASERQLFEFLILNVQEYTPIIVQGPTAAGKTFSIQLFADVLGKNLKVLQMNSEINSSYIAGSYQPSKELSPNDISELQSALNLIIDFAHLLPRKFQTKIRKNSIKEWTPAEFSELKKCVADLLIASIRNEEEDDNEDEDVVKLTNEDDIENAKEFINKVNSSLLFFNHLNRNDSLIIKALTEGYWLLLDGIESAPSDFLDRLSTLLDDPPILNLYERGSDYIYSTDPEKSDRSQRIHPDFRLFMTYNPINTNANNVSPSFLSRCSLFSMNPVDTNLYDSAVIVSGIIEKSFFSFSTPSEISARIATIHSMMKQENQTQQLTCRTLIHTSREIEYKNKSDKIDLQQLKDIIFNHYFQGHRDDSDYDQNKEFFNNEIDQVFEEKIDDKLLEQLQKIERNTSKACNTIINIINDLQTQLVRIINSNQDNDDDDDEENNEVPKFKYEEFLNNLSTLQLKDIAQIANQFKKPMKLIRDHISEFSKEQISYLASVTTIYELVNQLQSAFSSRRDTNKIQNLFLDSDYIRNIQSFSTVIYQVNAFTALYHRGLYMNKIPDILIDVEFANTYFQIFKFYENDKTLTTRSIELIKKNKYYSDNLPDDMSKFDYSPYKWDKDVTPLQQICSSLFKCKKCRYLFTGIMKDLFTVTYAVFITENINLLTGWVNWLDQFFKTFGEIDFNIRFDQFEDILDEWKESEVGDFIIELMNKIEKIRLLPQGFDFEDKYVEKTEFRQLVSSITSLYDNLKEKILAVAENRKAADDFFILKEKVLKLIEKSDNPLKKPYELLYYNMDALSQNITPDNYAFINKVFTSIAQSSTKKEKVVRNTLEWPTNQNLKQIEEKRSKLLESLISYSKELEKVESLEYSPKWTTLCELSDPDPLLAEFIREKSISSETVACYKSILRAQLLVDLFEIDEKDRYNYCNTNKLIMFFNQFNNRYNFVDDNWAIIATKLSKIYPVDFCISIPNFHPFDILSLLVNPLSKKQGCIFNDKQCPQKLIDDFYEVYEDISRKATRQSFKYVYEQIESIVINYAKNLHPDIIHKHFQEDDLDDFNLFYNRIQENNILDDIKEICEQIQIVFNFSDSITTQLRKDQIKDTIYEYLDFSDVRNIEFDNFNSYIDKNPCSGFYITQFPQVKDNISKIVELCTNEEEENTNEKFPLALFEFRIFSRVRCIEFQMPSEFPHDFAEEFQEFLFNEISSRLKENKVRYFSHFISFLLASTPYFINDTFHSDHLRNIVINLISSPKDKLLKIEIMKFFKRFLPSIIDKLGSKKWINYINEELKYDSKDDIIRFLTNPWRFALEDINKFIVEDYNMKEFDAQKAVKSIINMIINLSSELSILKLTKCVAKDESELQDKIYHEFMNSKTKSEKESEIEKGLNKEWTDYSKYIKSYFGKIQTLLTTNSNTIHQPENSFEHFHQFFSQKLNYLPCRSSEVIVLIPKKASTQTYTLYYTVQTKKLSTRFTSPEGKPMLFLPPKNQTAESLNLQCEGADIKVDVIQSDTDVVKFKFTSMKSIEESYQRFNQFYNDIQKEDFEGNDQIQIMKKVGKVKILFGEITLEEFINKLKDLYEKYHKKKIENLFDRTVELDRIREDVLELEKYTNISFPIDHMEKPHQTTNFLSENLINVIQAAKMNLTDSNFELFSENYIKKHEFFFSESNEFRKLMRLSNKLTSKPKNVRNYNIEALDSEMQQIEESEKLLTPSIFKNDEELKVTIKKIEVNADPLVFGVDVSPLQIRLGNFTEEEIICEFEQVNDELPLPRYRNEIGFLIIEIPVELICSSALNYVKKDEEEPADKQESPSTKPKRKKSSEKEKNKNEFIDIEETFKFEGYIKLSTRDDSIKSSRIEYQISLHYISISTFISIRNNHYFAFNDERVEIVPFLTGPNSLLLFEKFTDKGIKRYNMLDNIVELNDNKAKKPDFQSRQDNKDDDRITDITTAFAKEDKRENAYLSMNYEFAVSKEKTIQAALHINTMPKLSNIGQITLSIYSDSTRNFVTKDALINVGNLKRNVYFFVGILNTSDEPISPKNIGFYSYNYFIHAEYDSAKNTNTIPPNQYGYAVYYFEARYSGPYPYQNKEKSDGSITITINGLTQTLSFKYKINAVENQGEKFKYNTSLNDFLYYDQEKSSFTQCNIKSIYKDPIFKASEKQILVSPFCYSLYDKSNVLTRVEYDNRRGTLTRLVFDRSVPQVFEVFGYFPDLKRFMVIKVDKPDKISIRERNVYIFARVKDEPNTFFPLFCPMKNKNEQFDSRKSADSINRSFINFFMSMMQSHDQDIRKGYTTYNSLDNLFDQTPLPSLFNFSYIIDYLGKGRKQIIFREIVQTIVKFTNNNEFLKHFQDSMEIYKTDEYAQFYSFISAMNELVNKRYEELQTTNYYLKLPIPLETIIEKQNELFKRFVIQTDQIDNIKYIQDFKKSIQSINDIEKNEIKKFTDNGLQISQVVKWSETGGLTSSTIEELEAHRKKKIETRTETNTIKDENSDILTTDIKFIEFPDKITITSLYDTFREVLASTYSLTFIIYSLKKTHQPLNRARNLLNQLIAVFKWQQECSKCFPFSSFASYFNTAFSSMMQRLYDSKLNILTFPYELINKTNSNDFIQIPYLQVTNINYPKFTQPGLVTTVTEFKPNNTRARNQNKKADDNKVTNDESSSNKFTQKKEVDISLKTNKEANQRFKLVKTSKKVIFEEITENTKEIPDTEFIQYLIQDMIKDVDLHTKFEYKPSDDSNHVPRSIQDLDIVGEHNDRIDSFIEASKRLTDLMLTQINKSINDSQYQYNLLNKKDFIYASILVDCTSTLSSSYKAGISTLAIALANTLTAIKIPYAIVLFCDSNFQFILKTPDQSPDLIHFEKLLDTITVRRRMSDLPTAILMAAKEVKCSDANRKNHAIFALTDGLTNKLKLTDQWKNNILNSPELSVMFYFMDILSNTDQSVVHPIWDNFKNSIKDAKSPNSVIYSKTSEIYNGKTIFADAFINVLSKFTSAAETKEVVTMAELPEPLGGISAQLLSNITKIIQKDVPDESKFFSKYTFGNDQATQYTQVDLNLIQPKPLDAFTAGIEEKNPEIITGFLKTLTSLSNSLIDPSLIQEIGTLIFPPNKPSQFTPSGKGSIFYFPGLIKFILTQGQDTKIFLEKKAGLIRSYSVFFVIDNTSSCLNSTTISHAFQTIYSLLYPLSKIDIPSLNIIITTEDGPVILCSEKPTMMALDDSSPLWVSLFAYLSNPHPTRSCFYSALMNAYQMRIQQKSFSSVLFAITDGFYSFNERNNLNSIFESFKALNTIPITIGVGSDPTYIDLLTDKSIWAQNPKFVWPAVLYLFGKEARVFDTIRTAFSLSTFTQSLANSLENYLTLPDKLFEDLFKELNHVLRKVATYRNYYNEKESQEMNSFNKQVPVKDDDPKADIVQKVFSPDGTETDKEGNTIAPGEDKITIGGSAGQDGKPFRNAKGEQYDLGKKDGYKGAKLLIIMCWDCTCSPSEDQRLNEDVLRNGIDEKKISVINALSFYGIGTTVVKSYQDAINHLQSGEYSQAWVICGRMDGRMPGNTDPDSNDANLINQFIDCLIKYWHLGGGIVFWTDNYPLAAEVNIFLSKATFVATKKQTKEEIQAKKPPKYKNYKVNFHIGGDYPGEQTLRRHRFTDHTSVISAKSKSNCTFDGNGVAQADGYEKELFNHELRYIFEGYTIASAIKGQEKPDEWENYKTMDLQFAQKGDIYPFKPFSKSSSGGFSSLYYMSPLDCNDGNVVIDCGFSKLFFELTEEGIDRYVKNVAVWNLQIEKKDIRYGDGPVPPYLIRPPKFNFQINYDDTDIEFHQFNSNRRVDLVFMIDGTNSMRFFIDAARDSCNEVAAECHRNFPGSVFRYGAVIYRDTAVTERIVGHRKEQVEKCELDEDPENLHQFLSKVNAMGGGGDGPEDWVSGYRCLLKEMNWNSDSTKIVIHICDAPGHGHSFTSDPNYLRFVRKIPPFKHKNSFKDNLKIYNTIQSKQDDQFRNLIKQAAEAGIMFFCMNGKRNSMYCFKKTQELYYQNKGPKFVIQNQFGFGTDENIDDKANVDQNELVKQVKQIALSAVDIAVAVSRGSNNEELMKDMADNEFEDNCKAQFDKDFEDFNNVLADRKRQKDQEKALGIKHQPKTPQRGRGGFRGGQQRGGVQRNQRYQGFNLTANRNGGGNGTSSDEALLEESDDEIEFVNNSSDENGNDSDDDDFGFEARKNTRVTRHSDSDDAFSDDDDDDGNIRRPANHASSNPLRGSSSSRSRRSGRSRGGRGGRSGRGGRGRIQPPPPPPTQPRHNFNDDDDDIVDDDDFF